MCQIHMYLYVSDRIGRYPILKDSDWGQKNLIGTSLIIMAASKEVKQSKNMFSEMAQADVINNQRLVNGLTC